ncbi:hypothetical protein ACFLR2_01665, partial [Chlamydiota bacterium]
MTEISKTRHTFHYLDKMLSTESVSTLDQFFLELDVATHMVEGKGKRGAARAGYHILRGTAIAVQVVAYAIFSVLKYAGLAIYYTGKFFGKAAVAIFVTMPIALQKIFFPTAADLHEQRVETAKKALKKENFSSEHILGADENKHSYREQKQLLRSLIIQPLRALPDAKPEWKECCALLEQIADADATPAELEQKEERVRTIIETGNIPIRNISKMADTFIKAWRAERDFESRLTRVQIQQDPQLLLQYPHLLIREDVEGVIRSFDRETQNYLLGIKSALLQRALKRAHRKELHFIKSISPHLPPLDSDTLEDQYTSDQEAQFLENRLKLLEKRIEDLEGRDVKAGLEYILLKCERRHLQQQQAKMKTTQASIATLKDESVAKELDEMHESCRDSLREAMRARIEGTLERAGSLPCAKIPQIAQLCQTLKAALESLEESEDASTEDSLQMLTPLITQLHALELHMSKYALGNSTDMRRIQTSLFEYETLKNQLSLAHQENAWKAFSALTTPDQRDEARQNAFAQDVVCLALETKPECQIPLLLAKHDARTLAGIQPEALPTRPKGSYQKIEAASQAFVNTMREKHRDVAKKKLHSITAFVSQVQDGETFDILKANGELQKQEKAESLDVKAIGSTIKTAEDLSGWYAQLQKIWIEHMPREQEEMLHAIYSSRAHQAKMAECFGQWFEMTTGKKLDTRLTFEHLTVPDNSEQRAEALKVLSKHLQGPLGRFADHKRAEKERADPSIALPSQGFAVDLLKRVDENAPLTAPHIPVEVVGDIDLTAHQFEDIVASLERIKKALPPLRTELERKTAWVNALKAYAESTQCHSLRLMILAECEEVIALCFDQEKEVPKEIRVIFLEQYSVSESRTRKYRFEKMHNFERGHFLAHFLKSAFSSTRRIGVSDEQHARLKQLCSLSSLSPPDIQTILSRVTIQMGALSTDASVHLTEISQQLQASPIGLEGVEAETVRQSFKDSGLPVAPRTRTWLDSYMCRGTDALSLHLIGHVYAQYGNNLHHHAAREAIARALIHAHTLYPEETTSYIRNKIEENKESPLIPDRRTLAPPLYIFYCDLLRQLNPQAYFLNREIQEKITAFNKSLVTVQEANHLLMGFARIIAH